LIAAAAPSEHNADANHDAAGEKAAGFDVCFCLHEIWSPFVLHRAPGCKALSGPESSGN
jgi:hypothetical protein